MYDVHDWANTVLVSALTSGVVALGIEWLAKPRLEARKERILQLHRARWTFEADVLAVLANSAKLSEAVAQRLPRDLKEEVRRAIRDEIERAVQQLDNATREMSDTLADYGFTYPTEQVQGRIVQYVSTARGIQISDRTLAEKAEILKEITAPLHTWLFGPSWRFRSRYRALMELPGILAKYDQEGEPIVEPAKAPTVRAGDPPVKEGPTPTEG